MSRQMTGHAASHILPARTAYLWAAIGVAGVAGAAAAMLAAAAIYPGRGSALPGAIHMSQQNAATVAGERPKTGLKVISCNPLPNVPGKSITTAVVSYPPDAYTARHRHPGSVTAYVLSGTLRSHVAGEPQMTYQTGQSWFEPPGAIHLFAENASKTETASLLAIFVADNDCGPLVIPDPEEHSHGGIPRNGDQGHL